MAHRAMARRCERAGLWDAAATLLAQCATIEAVLASSNASSLSASFALSSSFGSSLLHLSPPYACDAATELLLLCARHPPPLAHVSLFHQRAGAPTLVALGAAADRAVEEHGAGASIPAASSSGGSDSVHMDVLVRAITALVVARRVDEAVALAAPRLLALIAPLVSELSPKGACSSLGPSSSSSSSAFAARTDAWRLLAPLCGVSLAVSASPPAGPGPSASSHRTAIVAVGALVAAIEAMARFGGCAQAAPVIARLCADAAIAVPSVLAASAAVAASSLPATLPALLRVMEAAYLCSLHGVSTASALVRRGADMLRSAVALSAAPAGALGGATTVLSPDVRAFAQQLLAKLDSPSASSSASAASSASASALPLVALTGCALPSSAHRRADRVVSRISRAPIVGPILALEAATTVVAAPEASSSSLSSVSTAATAIELGARSELVGATEALIWARVCAFSPTLSGARLEPF
jgi:hypothetical protein